MFYSKSYSLSMCRVPIAFEERSSNCLCLFIHLKTLQTTSFINMKEYLRGRCDGDWWVKPETIFLVLY